MSRSGTNPTQITTSGGGGGGTFTSRDDTDNQAAVSTGLETVVDRLYGWDPIGGNWDRLRVNAAGELVVTTAAGSPTGRDDTDDQAAVSTGLSTTVNRLYLFDGTNWDRAREGTTAGSLLVNNPTAANFLATVTQGTSPWVVSGTVTVGNATLVIIGNKTLTDAYANPTDDLDVAALMAGFNGTTWDRIRAAGDNADAVAVATLGNMIMNARNDVFNGTTWDRVRSGTATGSLLVNNPTAANLNVTVGNAAGAAAVNIQDGGNSITVDGTVTADTELPAATALADADANPTTSRIGSNLLGFNGATWDRIRSGADNADNEAVTTLGAMLTKARNYVWDSAGGNWDRWTGAVTFSGTVTTVGNQTPGDAVANPTDALDTRDFLEVYNGATWDRVRSAGSIGAVQVGGPAASGVAVAGNPVLDGGRAAQTLPTAVAGGQAVANWSTFNGRQRVYSSGRRRLGIYFAALGNTTVTVAADAATAGRFWLVNNTGATVFGALRRLVYSSTTTTGLLETTAPNFRVERITFTGTPSGATITPGKRDSNDAANTLTIRTASTGMTITAGAALHGFQIPSALATTSAVAASQIFPFVGDEDEYVILRAGEGLVIRQQDVGGPVADSRIANFDIQWEEFNSTDFAVND